MLILGLFLRRIILALDRMSFHKVIELKKAFESYIEYNKFQDSMDIEEDQNIPYGINKRYAIFILDNTIFL